MEGMAGMARLVGMVGDSCRVIVRMVLVVFMVILVAMEGVMVGMAVMTV